MFRYVAALAGFVMATGAAADVVGKVGVDWVGNDILIEAVQDPKVQGVTCHVAYFDRSIYDRLTNGSWFEDPSYSAIDCTQTGPITLGDIDKSAAGEDIFSERTSLIFKSLRITRIYDAKTRTLIYLAHASEVTQGSGKMSISTVPLAANVAP